MIKIENEDNLYRDEKSRGVINKNRSAYKSRLNQIKKSQEQIEEITNLKNEVKELKEMVSQLLLKQVS